MMLVVLTMSACSKDDPEPNPTPSKVSVTGVTLNKTTASIEAGKTETLTATVAPANATDKSVMWESSDNTIATVSAIGLVTGIKAGTVNITVKTTDGSKTANCTITVTPAPINVTGVTLNKTTTSIEVGKTETLVATVNPTDAIDKSVTWESSDNTVATVSATGVVTAIKTGTATITVKTTDGLKTATCIVTVTSQTSNMNDFVNENGL